MNPILPLNHFVPDGEPHVMPDGRLYLYGSYDISGNDDYCSDIYHVFSTDDPKLENWVDHGVSLKTGDPATCGILNPGTILYAPDCVHHDGKYWLYFPTSVGRELVAWSDSPAGPFHDAVDIEAVSGDGIDPAVFKDDDGSVYLLWGQFRLRGAKLNPDMKSVDPDTIETSILTEFEHGFHEGSSIRKFNGKYYIIYTDVSRGRASCLSYAMSDKPLGPYEKKGVLIDNIHCDPETWNDHGSIEYFKGNYYIFYHRSSQNSIYSRRAAAEILHMNPDGTFDEARQTTTGASGAVSAYTEWDASRACKMLGGCYVIPGGSGEILAHGSGTEFRNGYCEYRWIDFGEGGKAKCTITARGAGKIRIVSEGYNLIGDVELAGGDEFAPATASVTVPAGVHAIWFLFFGEDISVDSFAFAR